jgi:hypothetical protein
MSEALLEHPVVREYLRQLNAACASLPVAQARELREQIIAHLNEALPPGATDEDVLDELGRLGSTRMLAAAAVGPGPQLLLRRLRNRIGHVRWWAWVAAAVVIAVVGSGLSYVLLALDAPPLAQGSVAGWYYLVDRARSAEEQAGTSTQYTVPERFGKEQGLIITVVNNSDWTQTVVGIPGNWTPFTYEPIQTAVGSGKWADVGSAAGPISWSSPGNIPPHSMRMLRLLWKTDICVPPGGGTAIQQVVLTVRVGIFTRTEHVPLFDTWEVSGIKRTECH